MEIINTAYNSKKILESKPLVEETSNILKNKNIKINEIMDIIDNKYEYLQENNL